MRYVLTIILCVFCAPLPVLAQGEALNDALDALASGDRDALEAAEAQLGDPVARDIVEWTRLRGGYQPLEAYVDFLDRNPDWPGLPYLRVQGEPSIPEGADPVQVIAYFADQPPRTGAGVLALTAALETMGERDAAEAEAIRAWTSMTLTSGTAGDLRDRYGDVLNSADYHERRLDHLLWEGEEERARAMFPLVPDAWHALAEARLALRADRPGVDALIEAVPATLSDDPGLAYERYRWRMQAGNWAGAGELLAERSGSAADLGRPLAWTDRRADLARDVMREGDFDTCYTYAANHHLDPENDYIEFADLEWVAGYCALRLDRAETAIGHFEAFRDVVFSPISVGRAGYWLGRAYEAAGQADAAAEAYALGAQYQSSFYGQLAQERGGLPVDPDFLGTEIYGDWREASFTRSSVFHAALLLYEAGQEWPAERFLTHLTESLDETEAGMLGDIALALDEPHLALRIGKRAAQSGFEIMRAYYPVTDLQGVDLPAPAALALSIARRESEFDHDVISHAGAMGLMQVMPAAGRESARAVGVEYSADRLLNDPAYNILLGSTYVRGVLDRFDGNIVLLAAGYNAGPRRASEWIERFGDPRGLGPEAIVDWIEAIPFSETRNYIMRVAESVPIYEAQLTGQLPELGLAERLAQ